jgi:hypothetical protein
MRTIWDVLTDGVHGARVTYPYRPSHALVTLSSDWQVSVTVSPGSGSSLGQRFADDREQPIATLDVLGCGGSPEGWFDRAHDAEVAIARPDGSWYHCEVDPQGHDPDTPQPWRSVTVDELARLIARVDEQPPGCLCPDCDGA